MCAVRTGFVSDRTDFQIFQTSRTVYGIGIGHTPKIWKNKSMIRCGLSRDLNGQWRICPLFPHLQVIIEKHRTIFDGKSPFEDSDSSSSDSSEA